MSLVDKGLIAIMVLAFIYGASKGAIRSIRSFASLLIGIICANPLKAAIKPLIGSYISNFISENLARAGITVNDLAIPGIFLGVAEQAQANVMDRVVDLCCIAVAFAIISIATDIIMSILVDVERLPLMNSVGKVVGGFIGVGKIVIIIWSLNIILVVAGGFGISAASNFMHGMQTSQVLMLIISINPFFLFLK